MQVEPNLILPYSVDITAIVGYPIVNFFNVRPDWVFQIRHIMPPFLPIRFSYKNGGGL